MAVMLLFRGWAPRAGARVQSFSILIFASSESQVLRCKHSVVLFKSIEIRTAKDRHREIAYDYLHKCSWTLDRVDTEK